MHIRFISWEYLWVIVCYFKRSVVLSYHWWGTNYLYAAFTRQSAPTWKHLTVMLGTNHILYWLKSCPKPSQLVFFFFLQLLNNSVLLLSFVLYYRSSLSGKKSSPFQYSPRTRREWEQCFAVDVDLMEEYHWAPHCISILGQDCFLKKNLFNIITLGCEHFKL